MRNERHAVLRRKCGWLKGVPAHLPGSKRGRNTDGSLHCRCEVNVTYIEVMWGINERWEIKGMQFSE